MATQQEGAEGTEGRCGPFGRRGGDSDAGEEGTGAPEDAGTADAPAIDEQAAVEEPAEPMICAICNDPIDGTHLMAAYGPVHDPGCSSQTKRVP